MKTTPAVAAIALLLAASARPARAQETLEGVALQYLNAERAHDWSGMARLMHPAALHQIRETFRPVLEAPGLDTIRRSLFGTAGVSTLSDSAVFTGLMILTAQRFGHLIEALATARVQVLGHVAEGSDTAHVVYRMEAQVEDTSLTTLNVLSVARWSSGWRVLPAAELAWYASLIRQGAVAQAVPHPEEAAPLVAAGLALYRQNKLEEAADSLQRAVDFDPTNTEALVHLAEARRGLEEDVRSVALARLALVRSPCSSFAHTVLAMAYDPPYTNLVQASEDTTWAHLLEAVRCDPSDGNAWLGLQEEAMLRRDTSIERHARRRLMSIGFFSPSALAHGRWILQSLPPRSLLLTDGNLETHTMLSLQQVEGLRTDVAVVNLWLLHWPWYARLVRERYGVPLFLDDAGLDLAWTTGRFSLADSLVHLWRLAEQSGTLGRPVAFAPAVSIESWSSQGLGRLRLAGAYWAATPAGDTLAADTAGVRAALAAARGRDLGGPATGVGDHNPRRLSAPDGKFAQFATYVWCTYIQVLTDAGRVANARQSMADFVAFVEAANLKDDYSRSMLDNARLRLQIAH